MEKARFYLVKLPVISVVVFFFCCVVAAIIYPGSHKEIINYKSEVYSFTHNFLSELGSLKTNTDETNPLIIQEDNTPSMICLLYTSPSPRDATLSRMPSSA